LPLDPYIRVPCDDVYHVSAEVETGALLLAASGTPVTQNDVAQWIDGARRFDAAAWDCLYQRAFPQLFRYVAAKVSNRQEAEDLVEEVFVGALQSAASLRASDEAGFLAWLYQIARHKLADRLRRQYRRPIEPLDPAMDIAAADPTPEEAALERDTNLALRAAVSELTPEQQEVIIMKFVLEYDNVRTGAVLGKTPNAVNQLQHRALAQLRRIIGAAKVKSG